MEIDWKEVEKLRHIAITAHHFTLKELREILKVMWKKQDQQGLLSADQRSVGRYIASNMVPPQHEARLLRDRAEYNVKHLVAGQLGFVKASVRNKTLILIWKQVSCLRQRAFSEGATDGHFLVWH